MPFPHKVITVEAALKRNLTPLTRPYAPEEYHLMDRAVKQLAKDPRIVYAYVHESDRLDEISVFRKTSGP